MKPRGRPEGQHWQLWRCPKCGDEQRQPRLARDVSHPCCMDHGRHVFYVRIDDQAQIENTHKP